MSNWLSSKMQTFCHMIFGHVDNVQLAIKRNVDYSICWKSYISIIANKYVDQLPHREKNLTQGQDVTIFSEKFTFYYFGTKFH
jgi:hypothetical protein